MLPDVKVPALIAQQIPALQAGMQPGRAITKTISLFAAHTQQLIKHHQLTEVKQCFSMAGVLYHNGSALLKMPSKVFSCSAFLRCWMRIILKTCCRRRFNSCVTDTFNPSFKYLAMLTFLLFVAGLVCFWLFFKSIDFFEKI